MATTPSPTSFHRTTACSVAFVSALVWGALSTGCASNVTPNRPGIDEPDNPTTPNSCSVKPQLLMVADRSASMVQAALPFDKSHWHSVVKSLDSIVSDENLREGLSLGFTFYPRSVRTGNKTCKTHTEIAAWHRRAEGGNGSDFINNERCMEGEVMAMPGDDLDAFMAEISDPDEMAFCFSTPTGPALETAMTTLETMEIDDATQTVVLLTDGRNSANCDRSDDHTPLRMIEKLRERGISTYVIGFGEGNKIDAGELNKLACAGNTANDPSRCGQSGNTDEGTELFYRVADTETLQQALGSITEAVSCVPTLQ